MSSIDIQYIMGVSARIYEELNPWKLMVKVDHSRKFNPAKISHYTVIFFETKHPPQYYWKKEWELIFGRIQYMKLNIRKR